MSHEEPLEGLSVPLFLLGFLLGTAAGTWTDKAAFRRPWVMGSDTERAIKSMTAKYGLSA